MPVATVIINLEKVNANGHLRITALPQSPPIEYIQGRAPTPRPTPPHLRR